MENNQQNQHNHAENGSDAPKYIAENRENREKDREFWRRHRSSYRLLGVLVAIIVAIVIFLAGVVFGRISMRFSGGVVHRSGYGQMQMQRGGRMGGYSTGSTVSPAHPITPTQPTSTPTTPAPVAQ